jgi:hypothetical protein
MVEQSNGTLYPQRNNARLLPSALQPPPSSTSVSSPRPPSGVSAASSTTHDRHFDDHLGSQGTRKSHSQSFSSTPHTLASSKGSLSADNKDRQRVVRTLPRKSHHLPYLGYWTNHLASLGAVCRRRRECRPHVPPPPAHAQQHPTSFAQLHADAQVQCGTGTSL